MMKISFYSIGKRFRILGPRKEAVLVFSVTVLTLFRMNMLSFRKWHEDALKLKMHSSFCLENLYCNYLFRMGAELFNFSNPLKDLLEYVQAVVRAHSWMSLIRLFNLMLWKSHTSE